jgi:hypothetical protein
VASLFTEPTSKIPVVALTTAVVSFTNANNFAFVSGNHSATARACLGRAALDLLPSSRSRLFRSASVRRMDKAGWAYACRLLWVR